MGRKRTPGLVKRQGIWHIDKQIRGSRLCESTCTSDLEEADAVLARRIEEIRQATVYGVRPNRSFREVATKYLLEGTKRSLDRDARDLKTVEKYIGTLPLQQVHMGTLQGFIAARAKDGVKSATVNCTLAVVRRVLNLAARLWRDGNRLTWLETPPLIQFVDWDDTREPYPLSWEEQDRLLQALPAHLQPLVLFALNTGARQKEVCGLRWDWEVQIPELEASIFVLPASRTKNRQERALVLNRVARSIIEEVRGRDEDYVFVYRGKRISKIFNSAWKPAREEAGLPTVRDV